MKKKFILFILTAGLLLFSFPSEAAVMSQYSFVDVIGDVSEANYNRMMSNYCKIPENIREAYQLDGWHLSISTEHLEDTWFSGWEYSAIASGYDSAIKEIRVEDTKNGANAVAHEIGHYVDGKLGYISGTEEWKNIWETEITSRYGTTSTLEGFAEAFEHSIYNPKSYSRRCPKSYQFITEYMKQIEPENKTEFQEEEK